MRVILQRVKRAHVSVNELVCGRIDKGLLLLVGIAPDDTEEKLQWVCSKIINMRIFSDEAGNMNLDIKAAGGAMLLVSQFTLFASVKKGNRPGFTNAAPPAFAAQMFEKFVAYMIMNSGVQVETGIFGADMQVELLNDGPVTLFIDSENRE